MISEKMKKAINEEISHHIIAGAEPREVIDRAAKKLNKVSKSKGHEIELEKCKLIVINHIKKEL